MGLFADHALVPSGLKHKFDIYFADTMNRWHHWLMANEQYIDGTLKSVGFRDLGFGEELLRSGISLLRELRRSSERWLETILSFIYNSGGFLVPV